MPRRRTGTDTEKICSGCKQWLPRTSEYFYACAIKHDGLQSKCKACQSGYSATWRAENPEQHAANAARWQRENPDRTNVKSRRWRESNPEKMVAASIRWQAEHPEQVRAIKRRANRDRDARKSEAFIESVHDEVLFERDKGICGICHLAVDPNNWAVDHIIPLARQGEHSYANTRVAHPKCNSWKQARLDEELPPIPMHVLSAALLDAAVTHAD